MSKVLSTAQDVVDAADHFFSIADALHKTLRSRAPTADPASEYVYELLIEEYGLRTRAGILRTTAKSRSITDAVTEQAALLAALTRARAAIEQIEDLRVLRTLTATITTLCVSICPGKGRVIDFLVTELKQDLEKIKLTR